MTTDTIFALLQGLAGLTTAAAAAYFRSILSRIGTTEEATADLREDLHDLRDTIIERIHSNETATLQRLAALEAVVRQHRD